jgi:glutamate N-acetyltransferase / amino-acid N-acetyltransferase
MSVVPKGTAVPRGFSFSSAHCGLKKRKADLALFVSESPASAAAVFTTNCVQAAPVCLSRRHMAHAASRMRAVVVNSGNANCSTGPIGVKASETTAASAAQALGCSPPEVLVCSTGVIGVPLPVGKLTRAIPDLVATRQPTPEAFSRVTHAIMTTDTRPKWAAATCQLGGKNVRLIGCAKGAGMIHPNMATMLAFVCTDAAVPHRVLQEALRRIASRTFNAISVDGDTSTNDSVIVLANGASGCTLIEGSGTEFERFCSALESICKSLALAIVQDGEGAQRVIEIEVRGAESIGDADRVARTIANSPLVKTAFAGADANWGRILAAAGRSGVNFDPEGAEIRMAGIQVYKRGVACKFDERAAHRKLLGRYVQVRVDLGVRNGQAESEGMARIWTCDFTAEYVRINASYRS